MYTPYHDHLVELWFREAMRLDQDHQRRHAQELARLRRRRRRRLRRTS